jgi:hypothetical protein
MGTIVKFTGRSHNPEMRSGPYWAGQPLKEAFPRLRVRTPEEVQRRHLVLFEGELCCFIKDDGPEGAA